MVQGLGMALKIMQTQETLGFNILATGMQTAQTLAT